MPGQSPKVAIGAIAVAAALAGGAVAALVTVAVDGGRRSTSTVTVRDVVRTVRAAPASDGRVATRSLQDVYAADAPGVVAVTTTTADGGGAEGSGIVLDTAGHILTNEHVIDGARSVRVAFSDSHDVEAKVIGADASTDLAVLDVDLPPGALHPLPLGDSDGVRVGDRVYAIGNPFGLDRTLTAGIVSALHRQIPGLNRFTIANAIQTDAAINRGNSGGPLLDQNGAVIGINAQLPANSNVDGNVGIGFAIPIDLAKVVVPQLEEHGKAEHAWLGLEGSSLDEPLARAARVRGDQGILIEGMAPGSPIAKAGLAGGKTAVVVDGMSYCVGGDAITEIDGSAVASIERLQELLASHRPGQTLTLHVVHAGGSAADYRVKLGTQPQQTPATESGC